MSCIAEAAAWCCTRSTYLSPPEKEGLGLSPVVRDYVEETLERMQNDFPELLMTMLPRTETEANRSILLREGCFRIDPTGVVHTGPKPL